MNIFFDNYQDSLKLKPNDTGKTVLKAYKILPSTKIDSDKGAILPKEAISWTELEPAIPVKAKKEVSPIMLILLIVLVASFILIAFKLFKKSRSSSK